MRLCRSCKKKSSTSEKYSVSDAKATSLISKASSSSSSNENLKLREIATNAQEVERLKLENKIMRLELQKIRIDGDNQDRAEGSELSTELTNGKIVAQPSSITKPQIKKVYPKVNMELPERCPLCNSIPPCAHYQEHSADLIKSADNPITQYDEEVKRYNHNKSKFGSSNMLASRDDVNQIMTPNKRLYNSIPREFEQEFQDQHTNSALKSYAEIGFVSPKLGNIAVRGTSCR